MFLPTVLSAVVGPRLPGVSGGVLTDGEMESSNASRRDREMFILGGFGAILGGVLGLVISGNPTNLISTGIGILSGTAVGEIAAYALHRRLNVGTLISFERRLNVFLGVASLFLALGGLLGFVAQREWRLLGGAMFFGFCALYLLVLARQKTSR